MQRPLTLLVLTALTIASALLTSALGPRRLDSLPAGFTNPVLALEFVASADEFERIVTQKIQGCGEDGLAASCFRNGTLADFAFIGAYGLLWAVLAQGISRPRVIRLVGIALVAAAVLADCVENVGILRGLGTALADAALIRCSATAKWAALGVVFLAVAWRLLSAPSALGAWRLVNGVIALAYCAAASLCLVGVTLPRRRPAIEMVAAPIGAALLLQLASFWDQHRRPPSGLTGARTTRAASGQTGPSP